MSELASEALCRCDPGRAEKLIHEPGCAYHTPGGRERIADLEAQKDGAYRERDLLVAHLSSLFPSSLERHPESDTEWEDDWRWIVFIDLPTGSVSWHIHDSELHEFDHLPQLDGREWDGHTTEEKYERLRRHRDAI